MAKIYFKYGTMNSGKSLELLKIAYNYEEKGATVLAFKPFVDTRDVGFVRSRVGAKALKSVSILDNDFNGMYDMAKELNPDAVLVDEVQFFTADHIDSLVRIVDELGIPVLTFGLMTDFKGVLFPGSRRLVEVGARLDLIKTVCKHCTRAAVYNMRLLNGHPVFDGEQVQVGGNESYQSVCRTCYKDAKSRSVKPSKSISV